MKRPRHDLTWRGIRRRWAFPKEQANHINGPIGNHQYKSPSAPLLNNNFELLSSNIINADQQSFLSMDDREKQRSQSVLDLLGPLVPQIRPSNHYQNLSNITHSFDVEMIRSELRIIISHLATLTRQAKQQEEHDDATEDWKFVAMVVDRLCLIIFAVCMVLFTLLTLFSTPRFR